MNEIVKLGSNDLEIEVWTLGARLNRVTLNGLGNLVDGSDSVEDALGPKKYNGAVVGPVANRIGGASATMGTRVCSFEKNERDITTLHSGSAGVHAQEWTVQTKNDRLLVLTLDLKDGDGGFPGNRRLKATYEIIGSTLRTDFQAETDVPTWINLALHPYWTLGMSGRDGQRLSVNADRYTPVDDNQIPTGEILDVTGSHFDLRTLAVPSFEIDHNFCLNDDDAAAVVLESDAINLTITTDAPGVQIFTGKDIGIAIEPQHWPDAMHHNAFPSITLQPDRRYQQTSIYQFTAT